MQTRSVKLRHWFAGASLCKSTTLLSSFGDPQGLRPGNCEIDRKSRAVHTMDAWGVMLVRWAPGASAVYEVQHLSQDLRRRALQLACVDASEQETVFNTLTTASGGRIMLASVALSHCRRIVVALQAKACVSSCRFMSSRHLAHPSTPTVQVF